MKNLSICRPPTLLLPTNRRNIFLLFIFFYIHVGQHLNDCQSECWPLNENNSLILTLILNNRQRNRHRGCDTQRVCSWALINFGQTLFNLYES